MNWLTFELGLDCRFFPSKISETYKGLAIWRQLIFRARLMRVVHVVLCKVQNTLSVLSISSNRVTLCAAGMVG